MAEWSIWNENEDAFRKSRLPKLGFGGAGLIIILFLCGGALAFLIFGMALKG